MIIFETLLIIFVVSLILRQLGNSKNWYSLEPNPDLWNTLYDKNLLIILLYDRTSLQATFFLHSWKEYSGILISHFKFCFNLDVEMLFQRMRTILYGSGTGSGWAASGRIWRKWTKSWTLRSKRTSDQGKQWVSIFLRQWQKMQMLIQWMWIGSKRGIFKSN